MLVTSLILLLQKTHLGRIMKEKLSITFSSVPNLLLKVERIKDFAYFQKARRKSKLDQIGVIYEDLDDYGFAIDIDTCTKEQIMALKHILSVDTLKEFVDKLES